MITFATIFIYKKMYENKDLDDSVLCVLFK